VSEGLHSLIGLREAKTLLPVVTQIAQAVGYPQSTLHAREVCLTVIRPVSRIVRGTAAYRTDAGGPDDDPGHAHPPRLGHREAQEDRAQG